EIISDYEAVIREQKNRIAKLRADNAELAKKLTDFERLSGEISFALIDAHIKADEIIEKAKTQAEEISKAANEKIINSDRSVRYYRSSLKDLENRSERILSFIQNELKRDMKPALSIVNK
ncbi:MAG: DivIVA domain-containing protein, partial [Clostridia bacterium]|nr:DivIVA domain-containing protein [Clostridia bacterium]